MNPMTRDNDDNDNDTTANGWKIAEILAQDYGPRYVVDTDDETYSVDVIRFNGFRLHIDERAEVEYQSLAVTEDEYPSKATARFYDDGSDERPAPGDRIEVTRVVKQWPDDHITDFVEWTFHLTVDMSADTVTVTATTPELNTPAEFKRQLLEATGKNFDLPGDRKWTDLLNRWLDSARIENRGDRP